MTSGLAPTRKHGMSAVLGCVADDAPSGTAVCEVIVLKSGTEPANQAVAECRAALKWLQAAGAKRFYWTY